MAWLEWFVHLAARLRIVDASGGNWAAVPSTLPAPVCGSEHDTELDGLDFGRAMRVHQQWKSRLVDVLDGADDKRYRMEQVRRDDCCELGRWLHGPGCTHYGHLPSFRKLVLSHRAFHVAAADVLATHQAGQTEAARNMIESGLYAKFSVRVQGMLAQFFLDRSGRVSVRFPKSASMPLTRSEPFRPAASHTPQATPHQA
ncbi:hypothetical protein Lcho_2321 [Leptothrix cholodnii SP-6]|uniref:Chemoreceptor zinc-binding domain-containing protein n=1 Tax=Leptothrix cholodnii (strain ATCC 51168 / LMG 8142 / SP-6) TaxID=395495 RepID=B1Y464_LEPCP|nr:CZB domain-containing protein [Leptothrix cholodnii]ACB34586.1 hypothetical protein Lcho_2321 [Leptothrix cholodnii SP-6]